MPQQTQNPDLYNQSSMEDWRFRSWHVGLDEGGKNTNPITSENVLVAAGPPRLRDVGGQTGFEDKLFPIGMMENVQVSQQKRLQQIQEIGSRRSYVIGSHASGNISMSRVMFSHASLLRVLTVANQDGQNIDNPPGANYNEEPYDGDAAAQTARPSWHANLSSELFDRPIGLLFYLLDQRNNPYGAMYVEDAMVQNHSWSFASRGVAVSERASLMFDRANPVAVSAA